MNRALPLVLAAVVAACGDPVHADAVEALGPEAHGVEPGPLHRPGQPCLTCHGGKGPGNMEFSVAGTIYKYADSSEPLANAVVKLIDQGGPSTIVGTNCAGNFFVQRVDFDPVFPLWTRVKLGSIDIEMSTPVFRAGSCAHCHSDPATESSVGRIYVAPPGTALPGGSCP